MSPQKLGPAWSKAAHESASRTGQYCHDGLPRTFDCVDIDAVIFKRSGRSVRILEEKLPGEEISTAQQNVLPVLANLIELAINANQIRDDSGVYVIWHRNPLARVCEAEDHDIVTIQKVPKSKCEWDSVPTLTASLGELRPFLSGEYWKMPQTLT